LSENNKAAAVAFMLDIAATGLVDLSSCTPDATWWTMRTGEMPIAVHAATMHQLSERLYEGPARLDIRAVFAEAGTVAIEASGFQPLKNGNSYDNQYVCVFEFEQGRIRRVRAYMDPTVAQRAFAD
jgi:ketosteroid isomerase-like protein